MLLLVMKADLDERRDMGESSRRGIGEQIADRGVDVGAIARHLGGAGPRHQPAVRSCIARTGGDVIGIEQKREVRIIHAITLGVSPQDELLEEPSGVGAMPLY